MAQQTAIYYLVNYMLENFHLTDDSLEIFEQAKQMEKEQIIEAYKIGQKNGYDYRGRKSSWQGAGEWYNKTHENK